MTNLKIDKNVKIQRLKTYQLPADPEAYEIAKQMDVGDSVLVENKQTAKRLIRYIGKAHSYITNGYFAGGAISRADDCGYVRVWRVYKSPSGEVVTSTRDLNRIIGQTYNLKRIEELRASEKERSDKEKTND
jgi:exo-beta-1,3-glucanase (GH17 family)